MKNKNVFCGRKNGATIGGKFYPLMRTSELLARKIERALERKNHA